MVSATNIDLTGSLTLTYLVLGGAMLQLLVAGVIHTLPWVALALALLAMVAHFFASLNEPDVLIAWTVSTVLMPATGIRPYFSAGIVSASRWRTGGC